MRGNTNQERQKEKQRHPWSWMCHNHYVESLTRETVKERQRQMLCGKLDKRNREGKTKVDVMWEA